VCFFYTFLSRRDTSSSPFLDGRGGKEHTHPLNPKTYLYASTQHQVHTPTRHVLQGRIAYPVGGVAEHGGELLRDAGSMR
jgi:hypothetical protein